MNCRKKVIATAFVACICVSPNGVRASNTGYAEAQNIANETNGAEVIDTANIFSTLRNLVGNWTGINEAGNPVSIRYAMTANDTVLVEQWFFHNDMEAMTLYHPDGERLIATHYCPIGNQPRLELRRQLEDGTLEFEFKSATNLPNEDSAHEHAFDLRIIDASTILRNETYVENGIAESNGTVFYRNSLQTDGRSAQ